MNGFNPLHFNVGFVAAETVGYVREIPLEAPELTLGDLTLHAVHGKVTFDRVSKGVMVRVQLAASTEAECVRCLQAFMQPLEVDFTELFAFAGKIPDTEFVFPDSGQIDLAPLTREYLILATPMQTLCRPDCRGLCPVCGGNLNEETCSHEDESGDPRLMVLKALLQDEE
ncbi:MAG: DUF177 domain-containing protein [Anaerolineae bacterium]|nr:MAG: DUF177 domain-containing protein [Anaerolineae bacterium]